MKKYFLITIVAFSAVFTLSAQSKFGYLNSQTLLSALPEIQATLIDGAGKKIRFIRHVVRTLKLDNVQAMDVRAEALDPNVQYNNITSRAFSSLADFVKLVRPQVDQSTRLLAMKGTHPQKELDELPDWVNVDAVEKLTVPYLHAERHLVIMSLSKNTS